MGLRRGRPPAYDRDAAMRAIIETFRLRGFAATSLDDISTATGMNRPSLFAAFGNKREMYLTAMEVFRREMAEALFPTLDRPDSLASSLDNYFDAAIRFYCAGDARGCLVLCTAPAVAPIDSDVEKVLAGTILQIEAQLEDRIARTAAGELPQGAGDAAAMSKLLSAILISIAIKSRAGVQEAELREFSRMSLSAALPPP